MIFSRRRLFAAGTSLYSLFLGPKLLAQDSPSSSARKDLEDLSEVFAYGVASGDPLSDRVILWTHVGSENSEPVAVEWQVALDPAFSNVVATGQSSALAENDYTVKVDAILLQPGTTYYYKFRARDVWSPVGRTKTAPLTSDNLRVAVVSCSSIWSGYFNAYEKLALQPDLDLIIHCGDYTYDVPDEDEKRNMSSLAINQAPPKNLEDHRQRHRYYRLDPHLRAAHQQHPWAIVWDNHDILTQAPVAEAMQAFVEWIPMRTAPQKDLIYRTLDYGSLLKIIMIDARHIGRDEVIPGTKDKSILGETQFQWLKDELKSSRSQWTIIVNQVLMAPFQVLGKGLSSQSWDNYPKDRERLLRFLADEGIKNTIVVTGDAHFSIGSDLEVDGKEVGIEFLPTSVTRGNLDEQLKAFLATLVKDSFETTIKLNNPSTRYFESEAHGYGIVDLTQAKANCEFWYMDYREYTTEARCGRAMTSLSGSNSFTDIRADATRKKSTATSLAPREERLYEKSYEVGGQGGELFDGLEHLQKASRLSSLSIKSDKKIIAIACTYVDGSRTVFGGSDGDEQILTLGDSEYIRSVTVGIGDENRKTIVYYLKVLTSTGRTLEAGKAQKQMVVFQAPAGRHIVGFYGRSGKDLDKIGAIFAPDFA